MGVLSDKLLSLSSALAEIEADLEEKLTDDIDLIESCVQDLEDQINASKSALEEEEE